MSLIKELKRRNVFNVAIAYIIVGWLIMQVGDTLGPALLLPGWINSALAFFIILGFPLAMFFAWAFEMTPDGIRKEKEVDRSKSITPQTGRKLDFTIIAVLIIALGYFAWDKFITGPVQDAIPVQTASQSDTDVVKEAVLATDKSIAVLPFENRSAREEDQFFVDGIHDDILTQLARIGSLTVISRTSVERYRDTTESMTEIGATLGVKTILEGGVQRAGDRVRIVVQLIEAESDKHLWANTYDRELTTTNIFEIQSEIANIIASELQVTLTPGEVAQLADVPTQNLEALEAYFLGHLAMEKRSASSLDVAEQHLKKAIALDPKYAIAYVDLATTYSLQLSYSNRPLSEVSELVPPLLEKAKSLNQHLGEVYLTKALTLGISGMGDLNQKESLFLKGLELSPGSVNGHMWYAGVLLRLGRSEEALKQYEVALHLDPLSRIVRVNLGQTLAQSGQYDKARHHFETALSFDPEFATTYRSLGMLELFAFGRVDQGIKHLRRAQALNPGRPDYPLQLALHWDWLGDTEQADRSMARAKTLSPDDPRVLVAELELALGRGEGQTLVETARAAIAKGTNSGSPLQVLVSADLAAGHPDRALRRYGEEYPQFIDKPDPKFDLHTVDNAIQVAWLMLEAGQVENGLRLLDQAEAFHHTIPRMGWGGSWVQPATIHMLRGDHDKALASLRETVDLGWRGYWRQVLLHAPIFEPIRDEPEFQALITEIKADMAKQLTNVGEMEAKGELAPIPN